MISIAEEQGRELKRAAFYETGKGNLTTDIKVQLQSATLVICNIATTVTSLDNIRVKQCYIRG